MLILASASPQRRELLATLGVNFRVVIPDIEEIRFPNEQGQAFAERMAKDKAEAISEHELILAADTVVVFNGTILGKPTHVSDARKMLMALSGNTHKVITGVCLKNTERTLLFSVQTEVVFRTLDVEEIETYIDSGDPMDKAGAYAIQGGAAHMIRSIRGSYTNVVGLPLCELHEALASFESQSNR